MSEMINTVEDIDGLQELLASATELGYLTFTQLLDAVPAIEHELGLLDSVIEEIHHIDFILDSEAISLGGSLGFGDKINSYEP